MSDLPDDGFLVRPNSARKKPLSKDPNPEWFWAEYADILQISATKQQNPKWGARRISEFLHIDASEKKIKKILENYFFDACVGSLYRASKDNTVPHRRAVKKEELIKLIQKKHEIDHRRPDAIYESIRRSVFPVVRENVQLLYKQEIKCHQCSSAAELPKTTRTRRPIPATYPNSRWQVDLKKMPACRGFNYVMNVVDCYSRFGFGKALKGKSAKEVANNLISCIYLYGAPRILQSDNGREFKNSDLEEVVKEFDAVQMHGRPYHPQSQGRVERFNRTMTDYFRHKLVDETNWVTQLPEFYYHYNNRIHRSTRPDTPYQLYFKRPNFAAPMDEQVPYTALTKEEKEFLISAHIDVESQDEEDDPGQDEADVDDHSFADEQLSDRQSEAENEGPTDDHAMLNLGINDVETLNRNSVITSVIIEESADEPERHGHHSKKNAGMNTPASYTWTPLSMPTLTPMILQTPDQDQATEADLEEDPLWTNRGPILPESYIDGLKNVSNYYKEIYKRRFYRKDSEVEENEENEEPAPKRMATTETVHRKQLVNNMYPIEQFASGLLEDVTFFPNVGECIYYRLNPALAAGTSYFKSGFYRPGKLMAISNSNGGKLFQVMDDKDGRVHEVNRYQIKQA